MLLIYIFIVGLVTGSFLNVVIYRMPRDKSIVHPPSSCPSCGKLIRFYDNIPLVSWLILRGKCRYCGSKISARYFIVELLTGILFVSVFLIFFGSDIRRLGFASDSAFVNFINGGLLIYITYIVLFCGFLAASAIDLELWVIPISICWFITAIGIIASSISSYVIEPAALLTYRIFPMANASTGALAAGACVGTVISLALLGTGIIKRSYDLPQSLAGDGNNTDEPQDKAQKSENGETAEQEFDDRREVLKECLFLLPIIICALAGWYLNKKADPAGNWWVDFSQHPVISGVLGSLWGYFIGCGTVWITRILGTAGFGKEAMGLGDVHLMGAAGAVVGPVMVVVAFFIAPFFGLGMALFQFIFKKSREIPYGPFLSLGTFAVIILNDWFRNRISEILFGY